MGSSPTAYLAWGVIVPYDFDFPVMEYIERSNYAAETRKFDGPWIDTPALTGGAEDDTELDVWIALLLDPGQKSMGKEETSYSWASRIAKEADVGYSFAGDYNYGEEMDFIFYVQGSKRRADWGPSKISLAEMQHASDCDAGLLTVIKRGGLPGEVGWILWPTYG